MRDFFALISGRLSRKVEPPTHYVLHATKTKKLTQLSLTAKKKAKVAAIAK